MVASSVSIDGAVTRTSRDAAAIGSGQVCAQTGEIRIVVAVNIRAFRLLILGRLRICKSRMEGRIPPPYTMEKAATIWHIFSTKYWRSAYCSGADRSIGLWALADATRGPP